MSISKRRATGLSDCVVSDDRDHDLTDDYVAPRRANLTLGDALVLVDQDSVLANWDEAFKFHTRDLVADLPADYYTRPLFDLFAGVSDELTDEILSRMNRPGFYADLAPIDGAVDALNDMLTRVGDVRICSAPWLTNSTCASDKYMWNGQIIGAGWDQRTILSRDKTWVRGDFLIDDKPEVTGKLTPTWTHVFFTQRYNVDLPGPRINDWSEWEDVLTGLLAPAVAA